MLTLLSWMTILIHSNLMTVCACMNGLEAIKRVHYGEPTNKTVSELIQGCAAAMHVLSREPALLGE